MEVMDSRVWRNGSGKALLIKGLLGIQLLIAMSLSGCLPGRSHTDRSPVIATVGGTPITENQLERALRRLRMSEDEGVPLEAQDELYKRTVLDDLIRRRLVLKEADRLHLSVSAEDVDASYQRMMSGWPEAAFTKELKEQDLTPEELKDELRDMLIVSKYFSEQVFARIAITDADIRAHMAQHPELAVVPESIRVRQIIVKTHAEAEQLAKKISKGMPFEEAALQFSLGPKKEKGGDMGFIRRGELAGEVAQVCFGLPVGVISRPVSSQAGVHLFQVTEKRARQERSKEEMYDDVEQLIRRARERAAREAIMMTLRQQSPVVIEEDELARIH